MSDAEVRPSSSLSSPVSSVGRALSRIGSTVQQKYRITELLGMGGTATVYAATHRNGHRVAIKFLLEDAEPDLRQLFSREAYVANQVGHAGAVPVLDDDVDDQGCAFLIMPLLEGETLGTRWARAGRRLPIAEVAVLMHDALDVLASAHAKGIVHRDIKPDNLFVTTDGSVRILDFGVARSVGAGGGTDRVFGTPVFMPPEQAAGHPEAIGPHSDCWALGATMFALLTGEFVHPIADSRNAGANGASGAGGEHLTAVATQRARSLASAMPDLPEAIVRFVDKALSFDAGDRWPSAREMREALAEAAEQTLRQPLSGVAPCVRAVLGAEVAAAAQVPVSMEIPSEKHSAASMLAIQAAKNLVTQPAQVTRPSATFEDRMKEHAWYTSPERRRDLLTTLDGLLEGLPHAGTGPGMLFQLDHIENAITNLCKHRLLASLGREQGGMIRTLENVIRMGERTLILKFRPDLERDRLLHVLLQDSTAPQVHAGPVYTHTEINIPNSIGRYETLQVTTPASLGAEITDKIHAHIFDAFTTGYFWLAEQVQRALTSLGSPFEAEALKAFRRQFFIYDRAAAADKVWLVMVSQDRVYYAVDHQVVAQALLSGQASKALQQAPASIGTVLLANSISLGRSFSRQAIGDQQTVGMSMQRTPYEEVAQDFLVGQSAIYESEMLLTPLAGDHRGWLLAAHPPSADVARVLRAASPILENHLRTMRAEFRPPVIRKA
ncbi:serine/threonine protein kinase [Pendulispora rubella]|uniref:Serine/threonine protein kinase n=1 Tax=Pendulispora rubella TaxID=2741070 RepID=A0ABZ2KXD5_9BACT